MPVTCSVCAHKERVQIDEAVMGFGATRTIATQFGISLSSLKRHRAHVVELIAARPTQKVMKATDVDDIMDKHNWLEGQAKELLATAKASGDIRAALDAISKLTKLMEFLATISGAMHRASQVTNNTNIFVSEERLDEIIARRAAKLQDDGRREIPALPSPSGN